MEKIMVRVLEKQFPLLDWTGAKVDKVYHLYRVTLPNGAGVIMGHCVKGISYRCTDIAPPLKAI